MTGTPAIVAAIALLAVLPQDRRGPPAPTRIVRFTPPPSASSGSSRPGACQRSLVSDRLDAYRCTAAETTYDPCFATDRDGLILCDADPRDPSSGTLISASPPRPAAGSGGDRLRAWFFELEDGSTCRPLIFGGGRQVDGMVELYTCRFAPPGADAVLGEIDAHAPVWTVQQASLNKRMPPLSIKQLTSAVVTIAWQ